MLQGRSTHATSEREGTDATRERHGCYKGEGTDGIGRRYGWYREHGYYEAEVRSYKAEVRCYKGGVQVLQGSTDAMREARMLQGRRHGEVRMLQGRGADATREEWYGAREHGRYEGGTDAMREKSRCYEGEARML
jgi:hypothetical protein